MHKLSHQIAEYNRVMPGGENYVSEYFGGKYFGPAVARKIGYIREDIEEKFSCAQINARERAVLIASLLHAMDEAANIYAHYDTFKSCLLYTSTSGNVCSAISPWNLWNAQPCLPDYGRMD